MVRDGSSLLALAGGLSIAALGCAPDLTIGSATSTGGGGSSTATGGGGTTSSGGAEPGTELWVDAYPITGDDVPMGMALDGESKGFIAVATTDTDGVTRLDTFGIEAGDGLWIIGGLNPAYGGPHIPHAIARNETAYFVAGDLFGSTNEPVLPDTPQSAGGSDCLVGAVDGNDLWYRAIGTEAFSSCAGVVATPESVIVAGTFTATLDAAAPLESNGGYDVFVATLSPIGDVQSAVQIGDGLDQRATAMGSDAAGNVYVLGSDEGAESLGGSDIVLYKVAPNGVVTTRRYGTAADERPLALAVGADGTVAIAGTITDTIAVDGPVLGGDGFVAVFDPEGEHLWSHALADPLGDFSIHALLLDEQRRLFVGGDYSYSLTIAGTSLAAVGGDDAFVAAFEPGGKLAWTRSYGNAEDQSIGALGMLKDGTLLAAGDYIGSLEIAGKDIQAAGDRDLFLVGIAP